MGEGEEHRRRLPSLSILSLFKDTMRRTAHELAGLATHSIPVLAEEKLHYTMLAIRSLDCKDLKGYNRALDRFPDLGKRILQDSPLAPSTSLRNLAAELAKEDIADRVQELNFAKSHLPEYEYHHRKEGILRRLQLTIPSARNARLAVQTDNGITTEPKEMAAALKEHWSRVFCARPVGNKQVMQQWLRDTPYGFHEQRWQENSKWIVTQDDVEKAILCSNNSAPGPDGIPYMAWRKAGRLAVAIIHGALHQIQRDSFKVEHLPMDFNTSFLCCLPKSPLGMTPLLGTSTPPKLPDLCLWSILTIDSWRARRASELNPLWRQSSQTCREDF